MNDPEVERIEELARDWKSAVRKSDPDYSPAYQDEYQRLWHEAADDRDRLARRVAELERIGAALLAAYDEEETEDGFPFNFALRDAYRDLRRALKGDMHRGMARAEAAEAEMKRHRTLIARVRNNAESWHGPVDEGNRHAKALAVIAEWCNEALAGDGGGA